QTQTDVPVERDKHPASAYTVAVIIRPSAGDGIYPPELFAKTDGDAVALRQLLDFVAQVGGLRLGYFNARAVAVAFIPMGAEAESEKLEALCHGRNLRLFRRQR